MAGALAIGGLFGLARPASASTCTQNGSAVTCTFSNPNAAETFVVPAGILSAQITARGGSGGHGARPPENMSPLVQGGVGGGGGTVMETVPLTPGTTLRIYVGGIGGDGQASAHACQTGDQGGTGGLSGGIRTGGDGGDGFRPASDMGCPAGGGGGGSFVMTAGQTLGQVTLAPGGAVPLLVAGGGGGGGGGSEQTAGAGGAGGGASGATAGALPVTTPGPNSSSGAPGASGAVTGSTGPQADPPGPNASADDAGGGGGGGYPGGGAGGLTSGGGGGAGRGPATGAGPAGAAGFVTLTYSVTDTDECSANGGNCVAEPPPGEETTFKIVASGGNQNATLTATLNGGLPPLCKSVGGALSPDWVQFGFADPKDGRTWSKRIRVTGTDPTTSKHTAQHTLAETQVCFAAPYKFVVKRGTKLKKVGKNWEGLLAHCESRIIAEAKRDHPDRARPCVLGRSLVPKGDGWVVRISYFVPNGELDPQGRSKRVKKKKRH